MIGYFYLLSLSWRGLFRTSFVEAGCCILSGNTQYGRHAFMSPLDGIHISRIYAFFKITFVIQVFIVSLLKTKCFCWSLGSITYYKPFILCPRNPLRPNIPCPPIEQKCMLQTYQFLYEVLLKVNVICLLKVKICEYLGLSIWKDRGNIRISLEFFLIIGYRYV